MIRFIIFILLAFIIYYVAKFFIRILLGSGRHDQVHRKKPHSKYDGVEEAKFKEIDDSKEKNGNP